MKETQPKTQEEAAELISSILKQGDKRYNDPEAEKELSTFLINKAVLIEEKQFPQIKEPDKAALLKHFVQGQEKYIASALLKARGFTYEEIFFERRFLSSAPDVFAEKEDLIIAVECCSCRVDKIIDYLPKAEEVWVFTLGENPWEEKPLFRKMQWFIFKKGPTWNNYYDNLRKNQIQKLKKIQNPIDGFFGQ